MTTAIEILTLCAGEGMCAKELIRRTGKSENAIKSVIQELRRYGYLQSPRPKRWDCQYTLTAKGRDPKALIEWGDGRKRVGQMERSFSQSKPPTKVETMVSKTIKSTANSVFSLSQFQGAGA